jgi:nitroreductase
MIISRRMFLLGGGAAVVAGTGTWACSRGPDYDAIAEALWAQRPSGELESLVHYATLAANSHNAQPWRFRAAADSVTILPDLARALPVADPDNHHLYVSLGCAAENLALAAGAAGRSAALEFTPDGAGEVRVALGAHGRRDPLFETITSRQCTRSDYDGRSVDAGDLARLEQAARLDACELHLIDDRVRIEQVLELILAATETQVANPAFADELKSWLRFNARAAIETGDGLYAACSGNPTLPTFLGERMFGLFFKPGAEKDRYARQVRSSAGLAVVVSARDDAEHWIEAGRSYQRFALQATSLGIRHAHLNQPVEVASTRRELQDLLGLGDRRPDLVLRYGYAPPMPRSLRRPLGDVLVS